MNVSDEIKDLLTTRSLLLQRVGNQLTKDLRDAYLLVIDDLLKQLQSGKEINLINMNKIIKELKVLINPDLTTFNDDLVSLANNEANFITKGLNTAIGIDLAKKLPESRSIERIVNASLVDGLTINEWLSKQTISFQDTLTKQIRLAVIEGETNAQIYKRLSSALDVKNNANLKSLAKTSVATITNSVRMEVYKENEDIFKGYEYVATLDSRVTFTCLNLDGSAWSLDGKGLNEKGKKNKFVIPPVHFRCRSILIPITKSFKELGLNIEEVPKGTRSSLDGYVSSDLTADKWLESKPASFIEQYLGKSRYKLYKEGKITFNDLINQDRETLTVKELESLS